LESISKQDVRKITENIRDTYLYPDEDAMRHDAAIILEIKKLTDAESDPSKPLGKNFADILLDENNDDFLNCFLDSAQLYFNHIYKKELGELGWKDIFDFLQKQILQKQNNNIAPQ
jgi:hypothetical protein